VIDLDNEPDSTLTAMGLIEAQARALGSGEQLDLFAQLQEDVDDAARAVLRVKSDLDALNESLPN
jgi:hypothetical protein